MSHSNPDLERLSAVSPSRWADVISTATEPAGLLVVVLVVVATKSSPSLSLAMKWSLLAALFTVAIPYSVLLVFVGRGLVMDRHVVIREQRHKPLAAATASVIAGVAVLARMGAPPALSALVVSMLAGITSMGMVTRWYKASFHVAVAAGVATILALVLGPRLLLFAVPLVGLLAWARVRAGRHTVPQVLTGLTVGALVAGVVYPPLA